MWIKRPRMTGDDDDLNDVDDRKYDLQGSCDDTN